MNGKTSDHPSAEAEFLDVIRTKVFLLVIHRHLHYSPICHISLSRNHHIHRKLNARIDQIHSYKSNSKNPHYCIITPPLPSRSSLKLACIVNIAYGNLKSENSHDYAQKTQQNCTFMNSSSVLAIRTGLKYVSNSSKNMYVRGGALDILYMHYFSLLRTLSNV